MLRCEGWWEQDMYGRQPMQELRLEFQDGAVSGSGTDIVGPFTLEGVLANGKVDITKQYIGRHRLKYIGDFDGEGTMQGTWMIGGVSGGRWAIRIVPQPSTRCESRGEQIVPE
jgi:hypothetical protein